MFEDNVATETVAKKPEERVKESCRVDTAFQSLSLNGICKFGRRKTALSLTWLFTCKNDLVNPDENTAIHFSFNLST